MARLRIGFNNVAKRYVDIATFGGVDLSSPQLSVAQTRALDEVNYVYRENAIQKRFGTLVRKDNDTHYFFPLDPATHIISGSRNDGINHANDTYVSVAPDEPVYDVWSFGDYIIVHKGKGLFYIRADEIETGRLELIKTNAVGLDPDPNDNVSMAVYESYEMPERKMSAFMGNSKLWILTGAFYLVLKLVGGVFNLQPVQNNAYVPTTTIGITPVESAVAERQTYEDVNLLTQWRKNSLVGGYQNEDGSQKCEYLLDSDISYQNESDMDDFSIDIAIGSNYYRNKYTNLSDSPSDFAFPYIPRDGGFFFVPDDCVCNFKDFKIRLNDEAKTELIPASSADYFPPFFFNFRNDEFGAGVNGSSHFAQGKYYWYACAVDGNGGYHFPNGSTYTGSGNVPASVSLDLNRVDYQFYEDLSQFTRVIFFICAYNNGKFYSGWFEVRPRSNYFIGDTVFGVTDYFDYVGNIFASTNDPSGADTSLGLLSLFGYTFSFNSLYERAGNYDTEDGIVVTYGGNEYTISSETKGSIGDNAIRLVAIKASKNTNFVNNALSDTNSTLHEVGYPFGVHSGYFLVDETETRTIGGNRVANSSAIIWGYIKQNQNGTSLLNSIVLFFSPGADTVGNNIDVRFPVYNQYNTELINKCRFGCLFGTTNARNRLFVSGNVDEINSQDWSNYDWHTGEGETDGEFSYFPDTSFCAYGQNSNKVVGYSVVADGTLMVVKSASDKEASIYYRTSGYTAVTDDTGQAVTIDNSGTTLSKEVYTLTKSNSKIGGVAHYLFTDYNGDSLFVSDSGEIVGMDNLGTTYNNLRVASTRSALIDKYIKKINAKSSSILVSDRNELFFSTPEFLFYSHFDRKYEFFKLDIQKVSAFCHPRTDNSDYQLFGTSDGKLVKIIPDTFADETRIIPATGDVTQNGTAFTISDTLKTIITSDTYYAHMKDTYAHLGTSVAVDANHHTIVVSQNIPLVDGVSYYFKIIDGSTTRTMVSSVSYISSVALNDEICNEFVLDADTGHLVDSADSVEIYQIIDDIDVQIEVSSNNLNAVIKNPLNGEETLTFDTFDLTQDSLDMYFFKKDPVYAFYITAPYLSTATGYRKVVDSVTYVNDTGQLTEIYVTIATNDNTLETFLTARGEVGSQMDYELLTFNELDYARYSVPRTQVLATKFYGQFLSFKFVSPNAQNSVLTQLQFIYHNAGQTYGRG